MVKGQVTKIMTKALQRFAKKHNTTSDKICIFIRMKQNEEGELEPSYCKTVNGKWVKDDSGNTKDLDFNRDILDLKFDLLGRSALTAHFLSGYFKDISEKMNINKDEIFILIGSVDDSVSKLRLSLWKNDKEAKTFTQLKPITLDDLFGDD